MIDPDVLPEATAPREHHADFLELLALRSKQASVSVQEFVRDLKMANATETIADSEGYDEEDEPDEDVVVYDTFEELDEDDTK